MKGLNVKKLAAIAVGGALVGSALAPLGAAITVSKSDIVDSAGNPVVDVVVGSTAAASDFVWAGNIAAKVAQLATVETSVTGGTGTAEPTDLSVDLSIGGSVSYSTEYSKTYDGTGYGFNNTSGSSAEFIKAASQGQLPFLTNTTKSYRYNGSSYSIAVKETVGIEADARFVTASAVKDFVVYMENVGDFNYELSVGNGIPCRASTGSTAKFTDGDNDNIVIPFLGDEFTVQECDLVSTPYIIKLIKESAKTNYNEGDTIPDLTGRGNYAGEEMSVKIAAVTQTSSTATYQARFELYDSAGNLVDSQTVSSGVYLNESFLDSEGGYAMETVVYISTINVEPTTSKGVITMIVGKNVVTLANGKQYPYDSTDTDTTDDYWTASFDINTSVTNPKVPTVTKITVKNKVKAWNLSNPVWSTDDSLTQAGKDAAAAGKDVAHFLEGNEATLGYDFVKLKFAGFKYDQDKTTIKIGNGALTYKDSELTERTIPFYIKLPDLPQTEPTQQTFTIDDVTFYAKCYKPSSEFTIDVYDGNYLNGATVKLDHYDFAGDETTNTLIKTDTGPVDINNASDGNTMTIDLNGVRYVVTALLMDTTVAAGETNDNNGARLQIDGNCMYSSEQWTSTPNYMTMASVANFSQIGLGAVSTKTAYFDDDNSLRTPGQVPIDFTKTGSLQDTYKYRQYYSSNDGYIYLLLDSSTDFSNSFSNADVNFIGTDDIEQGDLGLAGSSDSTSGRVYRGYYWPDTEKFSNNQVADDAYIVAIFGVQADSTAQDDFRIHIDTATDNLIELPNSFRSNYSADVNCVTQTSSQPTWSLKARTDTESALYAGYLEYGSEARLTDDMETATFTIPEAAIYLRLSLLGEGATETVTGGETAEDVKKNETVTIGGRDITVSEINFVAGTCTIADVTYPKIKKVGQLVYTDSPAPAGSHIIVGGYLVNRLAQNVVLGDGSTLQEALSAPGDQVAEVLSSGDIIVAGYTGNDTKSAAQSLIAELDSLIA